MTLFLDCFEPFKGRSKSICKVLVMIWGWFLGFIRDDECSHLIIFLRLGLWSGDWACKLFKYCSLMAWGELIRSLSTESSYLLIPPNLFLLFVDFRLLREFKEGFTMVDCLIVGIIRFLLLMFAICRSLFLCSILLPELLTLSKFSTSVGLEKWMFLTVFGYWFWRLIEEFRCRPESLSKVVR